jgi:hypothetical protein
VSGPAAAFFARRGRLVGRGGGSGGGGGAAADASLVAYGALEAASIYVAALAAASASGAPPQLGALQNSLGVQAIVAAAWLYSRGQSPREDGGE